MPFKYHPPTRTFCDVCECLSKEEPSNAVIDSNNGKASSANNFPFHNWYNFVLGYSPEFPEYILDQEKIDKTDIVVDPFMGTGTTLITCKQRAIPSYGIDANDFMVDAARTKLDWSLDRSALVAASEALLREVKQAAAHYRWEEDRPSNQLALFDTNGAKNFQELILTRRPKMLLEKYISDLPLAKALLIHDIINSQWGDSPFCQLFDFALTSIIVLISNVRYGPGFGIIAPRPHVDVFDTFAAKLKRMVNDLLTPTLEQIATRSEVYLGDSRHLTNWLPENTASFMITSPPYPGDHEYTKHTRLELIFKGYAHNLHEFRSIKQRMLRSSTTNIYRDDNDAEVVRAMESLAKVTTLIEERLDNDGATSGFEKLYTKLVWEYFGGMHKALEQCYKVLRPHGKLALLVSDSHAFKMVHIQTASMLQEIGLKIGFVNPKIILWQLKPSTSHKYSLRENILILQKP